MFNKKTGIIITGVLLVFIICAGLIFINQNKMTTEGPYKKSLETYEQSEKKVIDNSVIDESGRLTKQEISSMKQEIIKTLDSYYGTIFNFSKDTKDYTKKLTEYYGTGELFVYTNMQNVTNIYPIFQQIHMESSYQDYHINQFIIRKDTLNPEVNVFGTIQAEFQNDRLNKGEYSILSNITLVKVDGEWEIFQDKITNVYPKENVTAHKAEQYKASHVLVYKGEVLDSFDFSDIDNYLKTDDSGIPWEKVTEPGLTILE